MKTKTTLKLRQTQNHPQVCSLTKNRQTQPLYATKYTLTKNSLLVIDGKQAPQNMKRKCAAFFATLHCSLSLIKTPSQTQLPLFYTGHRPQEQSAISQQSTQKLRGALTCCQKVPQTLMSRVF